MLVVTTVLYTIFYGNSFFSSQINVCREYPIPESKGSIKVATMMVGMRGMMYPVMIWTHKDKIEGEGVLVKN